MTAASSPMPLLVLQRQVQHFGGFVRNGLCYIKIHGPWQLMQKSISIIRGKMPRSPRGTIKGEEHLRHGHANTTSANGEVLSLQPGDLVEVKAEDEIRKTFDGKNSSKGLLFLAEMREYCGRRFRVMKRLERMMIESTGEIRRVRNTVLLEGVMCDGSRHHGCDRSCFFYWREAWLRRVQQQ
jgi:hypothetical protein